LHRGAFDLAVSTGFACALVPAEIGALLVGSEVVSMQAEASDPVQVPGSERDAFLAYVGEREPAARYGRFVSVDRIVGQASDKRRYARATAAMGLDMESGALAREARQHAVPFVIARTVSDLLDEDLPLDFNLFLTPSHWLRGIVVFLANARRSVRGVMRLRRQSIQAAARLTGFFRAYIDAAGQLRTYPGTTRESA
jgi:adenosylhomocysteine nucleosidase